MILPEKKTRSIRRSDTNTHDHYIIDWQQKLWIAPAWADEYVPIFGTFGSSRICCAPKKWLKIGLF